MILPATALSTFDILSILFMPYKIAYHCKYQSENHKSFLPHRSSFYRILLFVETCETSIDIYIPTCDECHSIISFLGHVRNDLKHLL